MIVRTWNRLSVVAGIALGTAWAGSGASRADDVALVAGSTVKSIGGRVRGQISAETPTELTVKLGASTQTVPIDQVASIRYDGQPANMTLAETRELAGSYAEAADLYKKAAAESSAKPFVMQAALFHQARITGDMALADPSKTSEAIALLDAFTRSYANGRHIVPAVELLARLQLQKGDYAGVEKSITRIEALPRGADRAGVLRARLHARQGNHEKALAELDKLMKAAGSNPSKMREARLAKAESLAALKRFSEAETDLRAVISANAAEDFVAQSAAYNTLGDCLRAAGRKKDALYAYLHTDLLYSKDKEQHPRALAGIVRAWREIGRDDRADEALETLKKDYPKSPWLAAAKETEAPTPK